MRQPLHLLRFFVILLALSVASHAYADERSDARTHYQTAAKLYSGGDYRGAIREFSAAQQLVPADLNNYNLALCYDKLGDAEPAIQYYRAFLDKQPNTDKRAEIEASISRLDAANKSAAAKRAPVAAPVPAPVPVEDANRPVLGPAAPGPDVAAAAPIGPPAGPAVGPAPAPSTAPSDEPRKPKHRGPAVAGSLPPSTAATGDPQLDRINGMNIDEIRAQRMGGMPDGPNGGPNAGPNGVPNAGPNGVPNGGPNAAGQGQLAQGQPPAAGPNGPNSSVGPNGPVGPGPDEPKKEAPVYKKWWFWAVVAVGGYVVYELATTSSQPSNDGTIRPANGRAAPRTAGLTLLSW